MPIIVVGSQHTSGRATFQSIPKIDYSYPYDLDLSPKSKLHQNIVEKVMRRADESWGIMTERHKSWRRVDEMMTAFIPASDYEKALKKRGASKDQFHGNNRPISVVVPYSYATYETIMTYMTQAFLNNPIFQFDGVDGADAVGSKLLELVLDAQNRRFKAALALHVSIGDSMKYGLGPSTFRWEELWGYRTRPQQVDYYDEDDHYLGSSTEKTRERRLLFEGNEIIPIDPYRFLPDPNVSAHSVQKGEFVGWIDLASYLTKIRDEQEDENIFNVKYLNLGSLRQRFSRFTADQSGREAGIRGVTGSVGEGIKTTTTNYITDVTMFIDLIPKEWGLPGDRDNNRDGELPEKWLFTVSNDILLTRLARLNLDHGMYPVSVACPDFDGYTPTPVGRMEMLHGLQEGMNWLYNSHIANVRKAMNDMLVVDPSLVVMKDLQTPEPGKLIRLRRRAWGKGVKGIVQQLAVADVTKQNISDSMYIMDIMQRVSAAVDSVQGIVRSGGERRSATEYRMTTNNAMSRLEHIARIVSEGYLKDMAYMEASHTQQFLSNEVYARITGDWPTVLQHIYQQGARGLRIQPEEILVDYDVIIKDGSIPTAGSANADLLVQLFQIVNNNPQLQQMYDIPRMYARIAVMLGDKNAFDFIRKGGDMAAVTIPDEEAARLAQEGNLVPV